MVVKVFDGPSEILLVHELGNLLDNYHAAVYSWLFCLNLNFVLG